MATETILSAKTAAFLEKEGFSKYSGTYLGCPRHGREGFSCPLDAQGNSLCKFSDASFWRINGENAKDFVSSIKSAAIVYLFVEKTGAVRKIGEGRPKRLLDNLKAHYNHGLTKSSRTKIDRASANSIAKKCRLTGDFMLYLKRESTKTDAKATEGVVKGHLLGWLDYDQGGTGIPSTI